ncbi:MAG: UbiA family prenyltransferase [Pirellulales bacterium]
MHRRSFFLPNWLPVCLSLPVLAWLLTYSYAKQFTRFAHLWLGVALGLSPLAAWIAIRGVIVFADPLDSLSAVVLAGIVVTWVTGFDIIYACQDYAFDVSEGLFSLPVHYGVRRALVVAAMFHVLTVGFLIMLPFSSPVLGFYTSLAIGVISVLLVLEHCLVRPNDLSRVNQAFFTVNAGIGMLLLLGVCADVFL